MIFILSSVDTKNLIRKLRGIGAQIEKVSDEKEIQKFILKVS